MPKRQPLQATFEGGVLTPLMYGRSELPGYAKSAKNMLNMFADSRGPAINRSGFEYKQDVADLTDKFGRLFTFRAKTSESYIVALTESKVWITDNAGFLESANKLSNPDFTDDGTDWTAVVSGNGSVTYPGNLARLSSGIALTGPRPFVYIEQNIVGLTAVNSHIFKIDSFTSTPPPGGLIDIQIGTAQGLADIVDISTNSVSDLSFTPNATSIWIRLIVWATPEIYGPPEEPLDRWADLTFDIDVVTLTDFVTDPDSGFVEFTSPYTEDQLHDVQIEMAPDLQSMYFVHRKVPPQVLSATNASPRVWSFGAVTFSWATTDPWTTATEYPGAIAFFQGRMYLAGTVIEPVSIWGSGPGSTNYHNFTDTPTAVIDDPVKFILARNADIQWMQGSKVLYIGCDNSEHIITSDGAAVVNSDVEVDQQSANGSNRSKSSWVSSKVGFISWDQRRLRLINFDSNSRIMDGEDLTFASEHLTLAKMTEMHHRQHPVNVLFTTLADGTFLSCNLEPTRGIVGWAPHSLGAGTIKSLTIANEQGVSALYALALYNGRLRLLRMGTTMNFMDYHVARGYASPTDTVDRLDHLEGQIVQVLGDGNLYPNATVTGGEITIDGPDASEFIVGILVDRFIETIPVDDAYRSNSSKASMKGWNRIFVRVHDSALPLIEGKRPPDRTPATLMDGREPNISKDIIVPNIGYNYEGTITVAQDLPFNFVVTGIYGELSEENL